MDGCQFGQQREEFPLPEDPAPLFVHAITSQQVLRSKIGHEEFESIFMKLTELTHVYQLTTGSGSVPIPIVTVGTIAFASSP